MEIAPGLCVDERDFRIAFIRSSGPGGQNVNKVATAAQVRFETRRCAWLSDESRGRLARIAGSRMTADGVIVITARRFRTQQRNRQDAMERIAVILRAALVKPKRRRKTTPGAAVCERRIEQKKRLGIKKSLRGKSKIIDD